MLPNMLFRSFRSDSSRKKNTNRITAQPDKNDLHLRYSTPVNRDPVELIYPLRFETPNSREGGIKAKMANKVSNFSDLIQRVAASCLLHPLVAGGGNEAEEISDKRAGDYTDDDEEEMVEERESFRVLEEANEEVRNARVVEMESLIGEVFDAVSAMKRAYFSLQEAHCPWDQDKMRVADVAVVSELRRLGVYKERFWRSFGRECGGGGWRGGSRSVGTAGATLREVVEPYEAAVEDLKREVKTKEVEVENLKEKLKTATSLNGGGGSGKKGRSHQSRRKVSCCQGQVAPSPAPDLFEAAMSLVNEGVKSFTSLLLSLMRSANWDIAAAVRSIEAVTTGTSPTIDTSSVVGANHAKYALESYVNRKMFQGFDHESFYMDGSLSSLLHPDKYRRDCFTQYRDMKSMDPLELLGILPTCDFGKFCSKKYISIIHPKMEESLFGDLEQRRQVLAGNHPRSQFYGRFSGLAKAVWLLHLLAFSLDPPPSHFDASKGAEFHPQYMESVVRLSGGLAALGLVVGFPVSPGFKLGNGSVIKARVYVVPRT